MKGDGVCLVGNKEIGLIQFRAGYYLGMLCLRLSLRKSVDVLFSNKGYVGLFATIRMQRTMDWCIGSFGCGLNAVCAGS